MARPQGSTFDPVLPTSGREDRLPQHWGFVAGKTNTIYPWDSQPAHYASSRRFGSTTSSAPTRLGRTARRKSRTSRASPGSRPGVASASQVQRHASPRARRGQADRSPVGPPRPRRFRWIAGDFDGSPDSREIRHDRLARRPLQTLRPPTGGQAKPAPGRPGRCAARGWPAGGRAPGLVGRLGGPVHGAGETVARRAARRARRVARSSRRGGGRDVPDLPQRSPARPHAHARQSPHGHRGSAQRFSPRRGRRRHATTTTPAAKRASPARSSPRSPS